MLTRLRRAWLPITAVLWVVVMALAVIGMWRYKMTPGAAAAAGAPIAWPDDLALGRTPGRSTVVMLAHPKCPCTRASIGELAVLMTRLGEGATAYVLFMAPASMPDGWEHTDTWVSAAAIPNVRVIADKDGAMAARLGASVSGHTVAYDPSGRLVFSGGITAARGHAGDNAGRAQIVMLLSSAGNAYAQAGHAPTFGCELQERPSTEGASR